MQFTTELPGGQVFLVHVILATAAGENCLKQNRFRTLSGDNSFKAWAIHS
jgi:hypothetical protein